MWPLLINKLEGLNDHDNSSFCLLFFRPPVKLFSAFTLSHICCQWINKRLRNDWFPTPHCFDFSDGRNWLQNTFCVYSERRLTDVATDNWLMCVPTTHQLPPLLGNSELFQQFLSWRGRDLKSDKSSKKSKIRLLYEINHVSTLLCMEV